MPQICRRVLLLNFNSNQSSGTARSYKILPLNGLMTVWVQGNRHDKLKYTYNNDETHLRLHRKEYGTDSTRHRSALGCFPTPLGSIDTIWINPLLGVVMFGMGLTLNPTDFRIVFSRPKDVIIGCLAQFTIMPITAWLLTRLFQMPEDLALGVILVGCCPGGTASNVITYLAKGDLALSVGMTATSTLLAPFLTPIITWLLAGTFVHVDAVSMFSPFYRLSSCPYLWAS